MIRIKVKVFALLKEKMGREELMLELLEGVSCQDVFSLLAGSFTDLGPLLEKSLVAVNGWYADRNKSLLAGDELAILPPVSGG